MSVIVQELKKEFTLKSFGFTFPKAEAFFTSQWKWPPVLFVIYRVILAFLTVGSLSAYINKNRILQHHLMVYMTTWSYILLTLHFNFSAVVVLYRFWRSFCLPDDQDREDNVVLKSVSSSSCSPSHSSDHEMDNCNEPCHIGDAMNNCILPGHHNTDNRSEGSIDSIQLSSPLKLNLPNADGSGLTSSSGCTLPGDHHYITTNGSEGSPAISKKMLVKGTTFGTRQDQTQWYMKVSWLLFAIIPPSAIIVTVLYFAVIYSYLNGTHSFEDLSVHGINSVLVILEMIVTAYPVRLLHVIYTMIFGLLYMIFTLIYWAQAPSKNIIYIGMLDWNRPTPAIILVCVLLFAGIPFLQSVIFLLYKCRLRCYRSLYKENYMT